jgi:hypothetical protein
MTTGAITIALPGKPDGVVIDPAHCCCYIERHFFASPDFYHWDERAGTWQIVRIIDRRKYL